MKKYVFTLLLAIAGLLLVVSCAPRYPIHLAGQDTLRDPAIVYGRLSNGFQYVLMRNTTPRDRVDIHLDVFAGSLQETDDQQGVAHYLEHLLFNGSEHFKPGELVRYFQSIGMDFGADANAHTDFFNTVYDLSLPRGDKQQLAEAFVIIQDYAQGALVLDTEIDRERGIIAAEKRERDSVAYQSFKKTLAFELPGARINQRFPIGIDPVIGKADRNLLKSYYDRWYRPDNMVLVAVGDFDIQTIQPLIIERFSKLRSRSLFLPEPIQIQWEPHAGVKPFYHYEPEAGTTDVTIETISWQPFEAQTRQALEIRMRDHVANALLQNRLSRLISQQTAGFSEASVFSGTFLRHVAISSLRATCDPEKWPETLRQMEYTLRQAMHSGFTQKELDRVKRDIISWLEIQESQSDSRKTGELARQILNAVNQKELLLSARQKKEILKPYIESLSLSDVHDALNHIWDKDHRLLMVTGNAKIPLPSPETLVLETYEASQATEVTPYAGFESKQFPYLDLPGEGAARIVSRKDNVNGLGVTVIDLDNHVRLNLKKTQYKPNEFIFKLCFGSGKISEPRSKPGLSLMTGTVINQSGLGGMDLDQLEDALAGKKVRMDFNVEENYFSFSGSGDPGEAALVFQLIYHFFHDPGYRLDALALAKERYQQQFDSLIKTADGLMQIRGDLFLAGNDSRFGLPDPGRINSYTLTDIQNWISPQLKQSPVEISIAGDFDVQEMIRLCVKYMGAFAPRIKDHVPEPPASLLFPAGETLLLKVDTKLPAGVVHVAFQTDDFWDIDQTRNLSVLSRIISEKLRLVIREELGESYSPYVYNDPSMGFSDYGVMHVVVNAKPENLEFVYHEIKEVIQALIRNGISKEETQLELKTVLNHLKVYRETNPYWLNAVMADSLNHPEKLDWAVHMMQDYAAIHPDDLTRLAHRFLKIEKSALIFIQSEERQ